MAKKKNWVLTGKRLKKRKEQRRLAKESNGLNEDGNSNAHSEVTRKETSASGRTQDDLTDSKMVVILPPPHVEPEPTEVTLEMDIASAADSSGRTVCKNCSPEAIFSTTSSFLSHHFAVHVRKVKYECESCQAKCDSLQTLREHEEKDCKVKDVKTGPLCVEGERYRVFMRMNSQRVWDVKCLECFGVFESLAELNAHTFSTLGTGDVPQGGEVQIQIVKDKKALCRYCGKLMEILRNHDCDKSMPFKGLPCSKCPFRGLYTKLKKHTVAEHGELIYKCPECRFLVTDSKLPSHFKEIHKGMEYFVHRRSLLTDRVKFENLTSPCLCSYCGETKKGKKSMEGHMIRKHTFEFPYRCGECNIGCVDRFQYNKHLKKHDLARFSKLLGNKLEVEGSDAKTGIKVVSPCPHCEGNKVYDSISQLRAHISRSHGEKLPGGQCPECKRGFTDAVNLSLHISKNPNGSCFPACSYCNQRMEKSILARHERTHTHARFQCTICPMSFTRTDILSRHYDTHKEVKKQYHCEVCKRGYFTKKSLVRCLLRHTVESQVGNAWSEPTPEGFKCRQCSYTNVDTKDVWMHHRYVHKLYKGKLPPNRMIKKRPRGKGIVSVPLPNDRFKCIECPYTGDKGQVYRHHYYKHRRGTKTEKNDEENETVMMCCEKQPNGDFKCIECSFARNRPRPVYIHYLGQHKSTKHICKQCNKRLRSAEKLRDHMNRHFGLKPHACRFCGNAFVSKTQQVTHEKQNCHANPEREYVVRRKRARKIRPIEAEEPVMVYYYEETY